MSGEKPAALEAEAALRSDSDTDAAETVPLWTEEEEATVRRKLDWQIVPAVTVLYLLCFLDRYVHM